MFKIIYKIFYLILILITFQAFDFNSSSKFKYEQIISKAKIEKWENCEIGDLIGKIALEFIGTPYLANTLEYEPESCIINFNGFDCVTFVENTFNLARMIKKKVYCYDTLLNYITFTRYRNGVLTDYTSRLHYTSEWIMDNQRKGVLTDITKEFGGESIKFNVFYMSKNSEKYKALKIHPEYVTIIAKIEEKINNETFYYIPKNKILSIEDKFKTGDIVAFVTDIEGLDYSHIGIIFVDKNGTARLLHASSKHKKVILDEKLSKYINSIKNDIGITILRATGK